MKLSRRIFTTGAICMAVLAFLFTGTAAEATQPEFGRPLMILRMPFPAGMLSTDPMTSALPEAKDEIKKIEDTVRKRIDFLPDQDLKEVRIYLLDDGSKGPLSEDLLFIEIKGKFDQGRLLPILPGLIAQIEHQPQGEGVVKIGSKSVAKGGRLMAFFSAPDTLCLASWKTAEAAITSGESFFGLLNPPAESGPAGMFFQAEIGRILERQPDLKKETGKIPEGFRLMLSSLLTGKGSIESGIVRIRLDFSEANGVEVGASMFDSFKSIGLAKFQEESIKLDQKADSMEPAKLLTEWRFQKTLLVLGTALLKRISLEKTATSLTLSMPLPEPFKDSNPMLVPATIGVLAAIAIPNFHKARMNAKRQACFANQRVLTGAIEMYNMDNATMKTSLIREDYQPGGALIKNGYLQNDLPLPEPGCEYFSSGDLTKDGRIECRIHGTFFKK